MVGDHLLHMLAFISEFSILFYCYYEGTFKSCWEKMELKQVYCSAGKRKKEIYHSFSITCVFHELKNALKFYLYFICKAGKRWQEWKGERQIWEADERSSIHWFRPKCLGVPG